MIGNIRYGIILEWKQHSALGASLDLASHPSVPLAEIGKPLPPKRKGREIAIASVLADRRLGDVVNSNAKNTLSSLLSWNF